LEYDVPYGQESVKVNIDEPVEVLLPNRPEVGDESRIIKEALDDPMGMERFEDFASYEKELLVVVNDGTRPTPTARIIKELYPHISGHPKLKFIIATGAHRAPTPEEYDLIFGEHYREFSDRVIAHDATVGEDMVYLGTSQNGTEMYINKAVKEADNVLVIGSVEPHYFAGYTGGRKSFLPGLASRKTIEMNHKLALSNRSRTLAVEGNAVSDDMTDALENLKDMNVFSIQTVLTGDHRIFAVIAGDLHESFRAAVEEANKIFCVPLKERGNIVITVAPYPMDVDLYQSQKAIDNGKFTITSGGVLILVSRCADGIGGKTFFDLLSSAGSPQEVLYRINKDYKLGYHKAAKLAQIGVWARMMAVTELPDDQLKAIGIEACDDLQKAVDDAIEHVRAQGEEPKITFMPSGSMTVPVLEGVELSGGMVRVKTDLTADDMLQVLEIVFEK
jgi:nickel-dependent lactate racemase